VQSSDALTKYPFTTSLFPSYATTARIKSDGK
jgi:hypothetical protein